MPARRFPIRGDVDLATEPALRSKLDVLVALTDDDLTLDCTELEFIDSTGISLLVSVYQALGARGRICRIEGMSDRVRRPFDMLGLTERLGFAELDPA